jgi:hypothetical protein
MARQPADEPILEAVTVPVPVEEAFSALVGLARWWPREYTWAADTLEDIGIEPRQGLAASPRPLRRHPALNPSSGTGLPNPLL